MKDVPFFKRGQIYVFEMETAAVYWMDAAGNIVDTPLRPGLAGYLWLLLTEPGFFEPVKEDATSFDNLKIEAMNLSTRLYNILKYSKCNVVGDILALTEKELNERRNCGRHSVTELKKAMLSQFQIDWPVKRPLK